MERSMTLGNCLDQYAGSDRERIPVAAAINALAAASIDIAHLIGDGELVGALGLAHGRNVDGDIQTEIDLRSDRLVRAALSPVPIAALASEEAEEPEIMDRGAPICIAIDPLDGSSNISINVSVGTIFSITPTPADLARAFLEPGHRQRAAGFFIYGPQTSLVLTVGNGVDIFTLDYRDQIYKRVRHSVRIASESKEFAINASNQRYWDPPIRAYIEDSIAENATSGGGSNMRWIGSLVAEAYRILTRGGVFLYPADAREGYAQGRLRLVYEAHPMAFLMEQAGGAASTGSTRILDVAADRLHQRIPLVMGSLDNVRSVERLHLNSDIVMERDAPLFAARGFFRA